MSIPTSRLKLPFCRSNNFFRYISKFSPDHVYSSWFDCISPGGYGPGVEETYGDNSFVKRYKALTPLGRFANDNDIKGPVVFLASEASAYITGHNLLVDGGWTSW